MHGLGLTPVVVAALAGDEQALAEWAHVLEEISPVWDQVADDAYDDWREYRSLSRIVHSRQVGGDRNL